MGAYQCTQPDPCPCFFLGKVAVLALARRVSSEESAFDTCTVGGFVFHKLCTTLLPLSMRAVAVTHLMNQKGFRVTKNRFSALAADPSRMIHKMAIFFRASDCPVPKIKIQQVHRTPTPDTYMHH